MTNDMSADCAQLITFLKTFKLKMLRSLQRIIKVQQIRFGEVFYFFLFCIPPFKTLKTSLEACLFAATTATKKKTFFNYVKVLVLFCRETMNQQKKPWPYDSYDKWPS